MGIFLFSLMMWTSGLGTAHAAPLTDALIFNGTGTSPSDTQSLINIMTSHGLSYRVATSSTLEAMSSDSFRNYRLLVWPGGDSNVMTKGLSATTRGKIRNAVLVNGLNYVGFCAGAWMAVGPPPWRGGSPIWGLSIVNGNYLKQYFPEGVTSVAAMVATTFPDGSTRDLVWWGGPYLPSQTGSVIAKYPNGSTAAMETQAGNGYVVLTGLHPEAPQDWRDYIGLVDSDGLDMDFAWSLIESALKRNSLAVF